MRSDVYPFDRSLGMRYTSCWGRFVTFVRRSALERTYDRHETKDIILYTVHRGQSLHSCGDGDLACPDSSQDKSEDHLG